MADVPVPDRSTEHVAVIQGLNALGADDVAEYERAALENTPKEGTADEEARSAKLSQSPGWTP